MTELETKLIELAKAIIKAHTDLFAQCCSNPIYNSWKEEVNLTLLNEAKNKAESTLRSLNKIRV